MTKKITYFILIFVFISISAFAQPQLDWTVYTNVNFVHKLAVEDSTIWLAAVGGIIKFNPADSSYVIYNSQDGLKGNSTNAITIDNEGNKWIGTKGNYLNKFDGESWTQFNDFDGIGDAQVNAVTSYGDKVWVATQKGITAIDINSDTGFRLDYYQDKSIYDIFFDNAGNIWIGTDYGIHASADLQDWTQYLDSYKVKSITQDFLGNIWVATADHGIYKFDIADSIWASVPTGNYVHIRRVAAIDSMIWVAVAKDWHNSDILRFSFDNVDSIWEYISYNNGFSHENGVFDFAKDENGTIWAASWGTGIAYFDGENWHEIAFNCIIGNRITGVDIDRNTGDLFLASRKSDSGDPDYKLMLGGGSRLPANSDKWVVYGDTQGLPGNTAIDVVTDDFGGKWFAGWLKGISYLDDAGTAEIDDDEWTYFKEATSGLYSDAIRELYIDSANRLWVGEHAYHPSQNYNDGGLEAFIPQDSIWVHFGRDEGIPGNPNSDNRLDCVNIREGKNHIMWLACQGGAVALDYGDDITDGMQDIITFNTLDGLNAANVWAVEPEDSNAVWVASEGGLNRLDHKGTIFDKSDDVCESYLYGWISDVRKDPDGVLWVATNGEGLKCYDPKHILFEQDWTAFNTNNSPLPDDICNEICFGTWEPTYKEIYVATELGLGKISINLPAENTVISSTPCPNPFVPSEGHTHIIFEGLTEQTKISIYNLAGELILESWDITFGVYCDGVTQGYRWVWDAKNASGKDLASGVYLFILDKGGEKEIGKIAIVR